MAALSATLQTRLHRYHGICIMTKKLMSKTRPCLKSELILTHDQEDGSPECYIEYANFCCDQISFYWDITMTILTEFGFWSKLYERCKVYKSVASFFDISSTHRKCTPRESLYWWTGLYQQESASLVWCRISNTNSGSEYSIQCLVQNIQCNIWCGRINTMSSPQYSVWCASVSELPSSL